MIDLFFLFSLPSGVWWWLQDEEFKNQDPRFVIVSLTLSTKLIMYSSTTIYMYIIYPLSSHTIILPFSSLPLPYLSLSLSLLLTLSPLTLSLHLPLLTLSPYPSTHLLSVANRESSLLSLSLYLRHRGDLDLWHDIWPYSLAICDMPSRVSHVTSRGCGLCTFPSSSL